MAIYNTAITATSAGSSDKLESGSGVRAITTIIVCNTTNTDKTLTLYAVPAGDTVSFDQEKMVLGASDQVRAICSASGLTATVSTLLV